MSGFFSKFGRDQNGAIAILFGFFLTIICVSVGGAIDFARYSSAKAQTTAAVDAAVLAGARALLLGQPPGEAKKVAQDYYDKNVADRFPVKSDDIKFSATPTSVSGSGNAFLETTLLKLAGISELPLVSSTGTEFAMAEITGGGGGDLEVSVMLDVTGSMCDDGTGPCTSGAKMDALKAAAKDLVDIVVMDDQSKYKSRVALVPFAHRIRVADAPTAAALTGLPTTWSGYNKVCTASEYGGTNPITGGENPGGGDYHVCTAEETQWVDWKLRPCVTERAFNTSAMMDLTDDAPGANAWLNGEDGTRRPVSVDSGNNPPTSGLGATPEDPRNFWTYNGDSSCHENSENVIMPLTSDKSALTERINGLVGKGVTGGALATAFSWYMLSPNFASIWPANAADSYAGLTDTQANGKPKLRKVAILMSDGVYNAKRGHTSASQQEVSDSAKAVCAAMKAKGIEIYTVGFDLDSLSTTEKDIAIDTLQSCGTSVDHFYNSLDPDDLKESFRDIAVKLSTIALKQ